MYYGLMLFFNEIENLGECCSWLIAVIDNLAGWKHEHQKDNYRINTFIAIG